MPAEPIIDDDRKLLITRWPTDAPTLDAIEAIKKYQVEILCNEKYLDYHELVVFSEDQGAILDISVVKQAVLQAGGLDEYRMHARVAIVANSDLIYAMIRLYVAYRSSAKNAHKQIRIFRNITEAIVWIAVP